MSQHPVPPKPSAVSAYRKALVPWYREHARDLPWRRDPGPYGVWVSEIMLQQTRVETVLPYWKRFVARFPDPARLAAASLDEVLEAWSGLGYYRRARHLHAAASTIVERHGGRFPEKDADVRALPGVGRYTAGAILSIALGRRAPILDGNVTRVLTRVFGIRGDVSRAPVSGLLWRVAEEVVAEGEPGEVNQAQMELGALVCKPATPDCPACPLRARCVARREGAVNELPELPKKRDPVELKRVALLVRRGPDVLLRKRREDELLPGMWDLPGAFTGEGGDRSSGVEEARALLPFEVRVGDVVGRWKHAITHRRIELEVREASEVLPVLAREGVAADGAELLWCPPAEGMEKALSSPARRVLRRVAGAQG
jgi:A/G-specific adenine glycosylase